MAAVRLLGDHLQVHGFYQTQVRSIAGDLDASDRWDLTQWAHILNVEVDWDIAPDGIGPFDLISAFGRVEARYDCVWTGACNAFPSVNTYGQRSRQGRLPKRLSDGFRSGFELQTLTRDYGSYHSRDRFTAQNVYDPSGLLGIGNRSPRAVPVKLDSVPSISTLAGSTGLDGILGPDPETGIDDDPLPFYFASIFPGCRFGIRDVGGTANDIGTQTFVHTVNKADCRIRPNGPLRSKPNPFNPNDADPSRVVLPNGGDFSLPYRPHPLYSNTDSNAPATQAQGVYYPNASLARRLGDLDHTDQNFRQTELAWNRGASQDEKELKELFVEFEMFDSRLWVRAGKQHIVWGKTELFRTTDQFNPQDLALGSLTSLEESRIALWSARGTWSFSEVGPLEDVRLELAVNYDDIEPADLGRCGEPYTPPPACDVTFGLLAHGLTGAAIAGYDRPDDPWDDASGVEVGARLEWRWGRFSMALIDFYGYDDRPWADQNFAYSRNVDPRTGRPRHTMSQAECDPDGFFGGGTAGCLNATPVGSKVGDVLPANNSLQFHSVNQQLFAMVCATTIGFSDLDPSSCSQSIFNSDTNPITGMPDADRMTTTALAPLISNLIAGHDAYHRLVQGFLTFGVPIPHVPLNEDPGDNPTGLEVNTFFSPSIYGPNLNGVLTAQQMALLGCGPFYGSNCELDGLDLLNAEGSALLQSLVGIEGTPPAGLDQPGPDGIFLSADDVTQLANNPFQAQPGTFAFRSFLGAHPPVCTRFEDEQAFVLPGCRGPGPNGVFDGPGPGSDDDPGYDPLQDGTLPGLHPFFDSTSFVPGDPLMRTFCELAGDGTCHNSALDQRFATEMGALSFNVVMALVALSSAPDTVAIDPQFCADAGVPVSLCGDFSTDRNGDGRPDSAFIAQDEFDPNRPFRENGCSFALPSACGNITAFGSVMGVQRNILRAGGNGAFGRRDFLWHGGSELILRFDKRNVVGFSMDFGEDLTKTNWGMEFTYIPNVPTGNNDEFDGISETDQFNLTIAVDRPTFVHFLNQNRTFFITTQWFMRYTRGYRKAMPSQGPWSALAILNASSGYFRDRLLPAVTFVYDFRSSSGALLPSVSYRFTENFSATVGLAIFSGRTERRAAPLTPISLGNRVGKGAYSAHVARGLSPIRERDEIFLKVRYAF